MADPISFPRVFDEIASPAGASPATIRAAFDAILTGAWTPVQVAGFAVALRLRGETATVITAAVESLRAVMVAVGNEVWWVGLTAPDEFSPAKAASALRC